MVTRVVGFRPDFVTYEKIISVVLIKITSFQIEKLPHDENCKGGIIRK